MPQDSPHSHWFAAHVLPHEPMLRAWLRSRFPSGLELDDVVQEAFLRVLRAHARGRLDSPKAFLFATARNLALDRIRHRHVAPSAPLVDAEGWDVLYDADDVAETVARNQELELLTEAIQSLPDRCRQVFTLRKVYGLSQSDIARRLGISEHTVSAQLTIGVQKCTQFMAKYRRERSSP
ncbi:MAG: sigma-70 family RNA polymerase sigma factor [Opitutus sp.]|nr:sigma-70 family RNA polymerase sigma factor [Opitutus sp.]